MRHSEIAAVDFRAPEYGLLLQQTLKSSIPYKGEPRTRLPNLGFKSQPLTYHAGNNKDIVRKDLSSLINTKLINHRSAQQFTYVINFEVQLQRAKIQPRFCPKDAIFKYFCTTEENLVQTTQVTN